MRKALFVKSSFLTITVVLFFVLVTSTSYSKDEKRSFSALKYNYIVETNLSLSDFSRAFYDRLKSKHKWNEVGNDNCKGGVCTSIWKFIDDASNEWKCEVTIKQAEISNRMLVTMEMNPVMGS
jgi:hypothetical protein